MIFALTYIPAFFLAFIVLLVFLSVGVIAAVNIKNDRLAAGTAFLIWAAGYVVAAIVKQWLID